MLHRQAPSRPFSAPLPPLGPDLLEEAITVFGPEADTSSRSAFAASLAHLLPGIIGDGSRARFARYLARPYVVDGAVDSAAIALLASDLRPQTKRQIAVLQLAKVEPLLAAFLDTCLADPDWRRFTGRRLQHWVARQRGKADPTSSSRLIGALKRGGYLKPFDRAWLLDPPEPSPAALLFGILREIGAPGQTTVSRLFGTSTVNRTLVSAGSVYRMLEWASDYDLVRWAGRGEVAVWLPRDVETTVVRLLAHALPEPPLAD